MCSTECATIESVKDTSLGMHTPRVHKRYLLCTLDTLNEPFCIAQFGSRVELDFLSEGVRPASFTRRKPARDEVSFRRVQPCVLMNG